MFNGKYYVIPWRNWIQAVNRDTIQVIPSVAAALQNTAMYWYSSRRINQVIIQETADPKIPTGTKQLLPKPEFLHVFQAKRNSSENQNLPGSGYEIKVIYPTSSLLEVIAFQRKLLTLQKFVNLRIRVSIFLYWQKPIF